MAAELDDITETGSSESSSELKKKVVDQATDASVQAQDDPSRSSLHYGAEHDVETAASTRNESSWNTSDISEFDESELSSQRTPPEDSNVGNDNTYASPAQNTAINLDQSTPISDADKDASTTPSQTVNSLNLDNIPPQGAPEEYDQPQAIDRDLGPVAQETASPNATPIQNQNEGPSGVTLSGSSVAENAQGTVIGTLDVADEDHGDSHSFTLSDDRFEVVGGDIKLKDGIALDHEDAAQITLDVTATDSAGAQVTQSFEINVADLNEDPSGVTLSGSSVAENAQGTVIGTLDVADEDHDDSHSFTLSDDRFEVVGGDIKLKDGIALDHEDAAQITLDVTATDSAGAQVTQSFEINVAEMPDVTVGTGFHASYFDVDQRLSKLDDIDWDSTPTHEELVGDINYANSSNSFWEGGSRDTFGAKITGNIEVDESGTFNFHIGGDDGVVLFVDGVEVVENDGLHGFRTRSGDVELEPGTHVIEVRYFENYGHAGLKVEWDGPGIDGRELLTAPDADDLQTVNGMPVALEVNIEQTDGGEGAVQHTLEGLPEGTMIEAGDHVGEVGADGAIDVTGWDTSLISVTPPIEFIGQIDAQLTTGVTLENGDVISNSVDIDIKVDAAHFEAPTVQVQTGFHASYFDVDHSLRQLDDIDWAADPTHEEVVGEINYQNGHGSFWEDGSTDTFGAKITGEISVEEGGVYDFFVGGDDGVVLFINGVEVIDNDGLHGYRTRAGEIELEPGTHEIEVRYFENYGHAGLKLEWDGPDTDGRELVQADADLAVAEDGALSLQLDTELSGDVTISGLPDNTIVISGEDSAVASGSEIDLSGWDLGFLEFMPPSGFVGEIDATVSVTGKGFNGQDIETQHDFTISVGDVENSTNTQTGSDEMLLASEPSDANSEAGWANEHDTPGDMSSDSDDDAMEENVEFTEASDQSHESMDTYERQDW